ncbi:MAG: CHAP domain-containing protein [Crinalium sp.]
MLNMNLLGWKSSISLFTLGVVTLGAAVVTGSLIKIQPANAATWCSCTNYVANRFGIGGFPHAKDWNNGYLQNRGFRQVGVQRGAVVVMETSFPGANTAYGHVGIVENVRPDGRIDVRGASQSVGSPLFTEAGCNNVRVTGFGRSVNGRSDISFWVR